MSDVRLSNASPTLERVDARQADNVRPSVRRNLFGKPDPEEIRRNVTALIEEDVRSFTETYNFDPVNERPLATRNYVWQEDRNAPDFYVRQPHGSQRPQRDNNRQDAETRSERQSDQPHRDGSRKRRSGTLGPCSSESEKKRSHTDEDDDDDEEESDGAGSQAVRAAEERPSSRSEESAEVQ